MKRTVIVIAVLLFVSPAFASGGRPKNWNVFGSDDHQRSHNLTVSAHPNRPVHPVPEPATIILLGAGLVWLAAARKRLD